MRCREIIRVWILTAAILVLQVGVALGDLDDLLRRAPSQANRLVIVKVDELYKTPMAVQRGWKEKHMLSSGERPLTFPPEAIQVVSAAEVDLVAMKPLSEITLMQLGQDLSIETVGRFEGAKVESLAGCPAVLSPLNAYFIELSPRMMAMVFPGDRQFAARWLSRAQAEPQMELSPYLRQVSTQAKSSQAQIILAIDLENAFSPEDVRDYLGGFENLKKHFVVVNTGEVGAILASVKGITLEIRIDQAATGKLSVEFREDTLKISDFAKELFMEILAERGANIRNFEAWACSVEANKISLSGPVADEGLRRIGSLIELPAMRLTDKKQKTEQESATDNKPKAAPELDTATVSREYFRSVRALIDNFGSTVVKQKETRSVRDVSLWMRQYARRIEQMPILNVDPELLDYGANVAANFREISDLGSGVRATAAAKQAQYHPTVKGRRQVAYSSGPYGYSGYGTRRGYYYEARDVEGERLEREGKKLQVIKEEKAKGTDQALTIMRTIEQDTAQIRRVMTERYKIEF